MAQRLAARRGEIRIAGKDKRRVLAGRLEQRSVHLDAGDAKSRHAALAGTEQVAFAAQPQILLGDAKPVLRLAHDGEARLGGLAERRLVDQQAGGARTAAADASAQLMELS